MTGRASWESASRTHPHRFSADGEKKLCTGPLHRDGAWLPIARFYTISSGARAGKPMSDCKECWLSRRGYRPHVDRELVDVAIARAVDYLGSKQAVALRLGYHRSHFSRKRRRYKADLLDKLRELLRELDGPYPSRSKPIEVVETRKLARILSAVIREEDGGIAAVALTVGVDESRIRHIVNGSRVYTSLAGADKILTALDMQYLLGGDELPVLLNPDMTFEQLLHHLSRLGLI